MLKAFKYRLYPTKEQTILLNKHIGCVRLVYNLAYGTKTMAYSSTNRTNLNKYDLLNELPLLLSESVKNINKADDVNHPPSKERWACRKTLTRTNYGLNGRIA